MRYTNERYLLRLMAHDQSSSSKLLVPDKSGTRMHDRLAKFLVRYSGTSNLDGDLGSCAYLLASLFRSAAQLGD